MKRITRSLLLMFLTALMLAVIFPAGVFAASRKVTPQPVILTKATAPAYNKIKLQWKKVSGATHYKIYYKKAGARRWKAVATVGSGKTSYTHTSSKSRPVTVGRKYTYTVRGYNSKYKTKGDYDRKGLTVYTKPSTVKLKKASLSSNKKTVTVSWKKASGCNYYHVFRKTTSTGWKRIASVKKGTTSYTDKKPVKGKKNIYTVRGYYSSTKRYGNYNSKGVSVSVPGSSTQTAGKAKYSYELKLINPYKEVYNTSSTGPVLYIKTKNPDYRSIMLYSDPYACSEVVLYEGLFDDVKGVQVGNWLKVSGGYLCRPDLEKAGTYKFRVREVKPEYKDYDYYNDGSLKYCYETNGAVTVQVKDYKKSGIEWIQSLIKKYTKPGMSPKEKFEAVIYGEFDSYSGPANQKYRYHAVKYDKPSGEYRYANLLAEEGSIWQNHRLDSYTSPILMCDIGNLVGYKVEIITFNVTDPYHAYVKAPDGQLYSICPMMETGDIGQVKYIDFSKY